MESYDNVLTKSNVEQTSICQKEDTKCLSNHHVNLFTQKSPPTTERDIRDKKQKFRFNRSSATKYNNDIDEELPRFDSLQNCLDNVDDKCYNNLIPLLLKTYENNKVDEIQSNSYMKMFNKICNIIKKVHPTARPQLFGSINNGFMTKTSDLDICIECYTKSGLEEKITRKGMVPMLQRVGQALKREIPEIHLEYVFAAKVPIVKFFINGHIHGDISINNTLALYNTKLLRFYADLSPVAKQMGILLKYVTKICEISDASQGTLSSYAYIILLVHFLQKRNVLPVLQEMYDEEGKEGRFKGQNNWFQDNLQFINKTWQASDKHNLGYLWLDFFHYYAVEFDINEQVVCIRSSTPLYKKDKKWQISDFAIEDPFETNRNLGKNLYFTKSLTILQCFAHILEMHSNPEILNDKIMIQNIMKPENLRINQNYENDQKSSFKQMKNQRRKPIKYPKMNPREYRLIPNFIGHPAVPPHQYSRFTNRPQNHYSNQGYQPISYFGNYIPPYQQYVPPYQQYVPPYQPYVPYYDGYNSCSYRAKPPYTHYTNYYTRHQKPHNVPKYY